MFLKRLFIDQWATWFMSLILAAIVWGYLFYESSDTRTLDVEVRLQGLDREHIEGLRILERNGRPLEGNKIAVIISGSKGLVQSLQNREIQCTYTVDRLTDNPHPFVLSAQNFDLPEGLLLKFVTGPELKLSYEPLVEVQAKLMPTRPDPRHQPAADFVFEGYEITPEIVTVRIPQSKREWVLAHGIPIQAPDITGWASSRAAPVVPQVEFSVKVMNNVQMQVLIRIKKATKTLVKIPINVMFNPALRIGRVEITATATCDITLESKESLLERLTPASVRAFAYIDEEPTQDGRIITPAIEVRILLPEEQRALVSVVKVDPQNATMKLFLPK